MESINFDKAGEVVKAYNYDAAKLIPILQEVQEEYRWLPEELISFIAAQLKISPAKVYGVATFFSHFALSPKGKHIIKVCDGTACHVKKSTAIIDAIKRKLNLKGEQVNSQDMLFTLEAVACVGACGIAPVVLVGEDVYGQVTPDKIVQVLDEVIKKEAGAQSQAGAK